MGPLSNFTFAEQPAQWSCFVASLVHQEETKPSESSEHHGQPVCWDILERLPYLHADLIFESLIYVQFANVVVA